MSIPRLFQRKMTYTSNDWWWLFFKPVSWKKKLLNLSTFAMDNNEWKKKNILCIIDISHRIYKNCTERVLLSKFNYYTPTLYLNISILYRTYLLKSIAL